ncbi:XRE family transcriptional regulator [Microbacterium sp. Gd 4-13]|uniref:helix-turn-helix domain-containing protein n=1 Tax=Microbacterium sp. Gd 4-13 TaxID=2173179 RepID=UPI000D5697F7|nr:helix-turn-helix transcriptional regulator [Microbacterium sp. Gd 4-13]PVW03028.1 XRE family transcriptional regulator [Microbacterium sp. Gd 4-13]
MNDESDEEWWTFAIALGEAVTAARESIGLSAAEAAEAAGIATFTYTKLERGESNPGRPANPRLRTLRSVARVLNVPVTSLLLAAESRAQG